MKRTRPYDMRPLHTWVKATRRNLRASRKRLGRSERWYQARCREMGIAP